jgi:hypothetical protein
VRTGTQRTHLAPFYVNEGSFPPVDGAPVLALVKQTALEHPYLGIEHVLLARLWIAGLFAERKALLGTLSSGTPRRLWRPRGPNSALRRRGLAETRSARRNAEARDAGRSDSH